ncbi:MAG: M20/M25/M40 family metallo-hydrolase [Clostridia bacterium]|nr:M20/M25/M40 family metallo-hydrolase [Clostridia bacterium]
MVGWIIGLGLAAAFLIFVAVILIRAIRFKPKEQKILSREEITVDADAAIKALRELVKCKTVSYYDHSLEDDAEFEKLISLIPSLYPEVVRVCPMQRLDGRALLFRWEGKAHDAPSVMMAHYDVVPVDESGWEKPAFEAIIEDGVLWGRGTLDTKVTFNGILSAANELISRGFVPEQDVYLAFSGGEEVNGEGAVNIVNYFKDNGITPALVLDEGGAVVEGVFPGVKTPCGLIGIAEKGMMNLTFEVQSNGGHASAPAPHTPVGVLSKACCAMESNPFKMHVTTPAAAMFDTLGRHSTFLYRVIFANFGIFKGVLDLLGKKQGGEMNALLRTTVAFTQASGSAAPNVIPPSATMTANFRLNPEDSIDDALKYVEKTVNDPSVKLSLGSSMEPSPVSEIGCPAWDKVASAVAGTWEGCIVSPYLMVQCSDSRHYRDISNHVYKFSAMALTKEERGSIHGHNEKIRLEAIPKAVEFFIRVMKQC